jgi:hypothetical protein
MSNCISKPKYNKLIFSPWVEQHSVDCQYAVFGQPASFLLVNSEEESSTSTANSAIILDELSA